MPGRFRPEGLTLGLLLVGLGVLWTLSNLGRIDLLSTLHTWWPLALVVWGLVELAAVLTGGKGTP
jgi:hypothetical protein